MTKGGVMKGATVMMVVRYDKKVKKKSFDFPIPDLVVHSIDLLIEGINSGDLLADCYAAELYNNINNCLHLDFTDEQADELRDYYLRGGMYEDD